MRDFTNVQYTIDAGNSLVSINDAWVSEARTVPEPSLAPPGVLGRGLWELILDWPLQHLFDNLFQRLRGGLIPRVAYLFRCDTPGARRLHRLTITPDPDQSLHFQSVTVAVHERPRTPLLDPSLPRSAEQLRICGWCKRISLPGQGWVEVEDALGRLDALDVGPLPAISHGICPACETRMLALLENPSAAGPDVITFGDWRSD